LGTVIIANKTMDPQPASSPDLHMPPPDLRQDEATIPGIGSDLSSGVPKVAEVNDTVLMAHNSEAPQPAVSAKPGNDQTQGVTNTVGNDDDDDSLDEEWIQKAKVIVDQTKADPYQQSKEISKVKANYLKTHYNKEIKVADDQSL
jgi:hypothetical protein